MNDIDRSYALARRRIAKLDAEQVRDLLANVIVTVWCTDEQHTLPGHAHLDGGADFNAAVCEFLPDELTATPSAEELIAETNSQRDERAPVQRVEDWGRISQAINSIADIQADDADRLGVLLDLANSAKAVIVQLGVPRTNAARSMPTRVESIRDDMLGMYDQLARVRALLKIDAGTDVVGATDDSVSKLEDAEHRVEDARLAFDLLVERFARQVKREEQIISTSAALFAELLGRTVPSVDINDLTTARGA